MSLFSSRADAISDSLTLDELINRALLTYPTILSREASKDAATSDVTVAKLRFLPTPSINTQLNNVDFDNNAASNRSPATNITINQPIWAGGALTAGYNKANAKLSASDFAVLETREDVSRRLISAYAEWFKAYHKIEALKENVLIHQKLASLITHRHDEGVASGADRDLGFSRLLQAQSDLATQRVQEETALTTISELVGERISSQQLIQKKASSVILPRRDELIAKAISRSVSIQRYKSEAVAAEAEASEVGAQSLPQVSLQMQRQFGNAYFPGSPGFTSFGFVVGYSPGAGLSSMAASRSANDRARAALIQVDAVRSELLERLNAEYNEYEFSLLKQDNLKRSADLSKDIRDSYDRQYLVGRKSWLDLMNAVRERAQSNMALADVNGSILGSSRKLAVYAGLENSTPPAAVVLQDVSINSNEHPSALIEDEKSNIEQAVDKRLERYKFWVEKSKKGSLKPSVSGLNSVVSDQQDKNLLDKLKFWKNQSEIKTDQATNNNLPNKSNTLELNRLSQDEGSENIASKGTSENQSTEIAQNNDATQSVEDRKSAESSLETEGTSQTEIVALQTLPPVQAQMTPSEDEPKKSQIKPIDEFNSIHKNSVLAALNAWVDTWRAKKVKAYLNFYSSHFQPEGLTKSAWVLQRKQRMNRAGHINLSLENVNIVADEKKANVRFFQNYRSGNFKDRVEKIMDFENINGQWLIVRETIG